MRLLRATTHLYRKTLSHPRPSLSPMGERNLATYGSHVRHDRRLPSDCAKIFESHVRDEDRVLSEKVFWEGL